MPLPPLLSERPPAVQRTLLIAGPIIGGVITGISLGISEAAWAIANVVMILGGVAAGFDHDGAGEGARRGLFGGAVFGTALLLTDAISGMDRAAKLPDPAILLLIVTTVAGTLLGALGGALRARAQRRAAVEIEPAA